MIGKSFIISSIKRPINDDEIIVFEKVKKIIKKLSIKENYELNIAKKSVDARKKNDIFLVYSISIKFNDFVEIDDYKAKEFQISLFNEEKLNFSFGNAKIKYNPLIVGMGPCGMFSALLLAENGYNPIIIDRGSNVEERIKAVDNFVKNGILDKNTNIQFGAGGAGTFSDGKLTTRINDSKCNYVLNRFVEFGAPQEILYKAKPHIGTDVLRIVVDNILKKIEALGGRVIYNCTLLDIEKQEDFVIAKTNVGYFKTSALILALGHSARDTYRMLLSRGFTIEPKDYSVGVRIEHLAKDIDKALYGNFAGHKELAHAEYTLSDTTKDRGVYTFCMCPGGTVVPATSDENSVVVNGMSNFNRDGKNSNCAINVTIRKDDYQSTPIRAIEFQENIEKKAFVLGGADYSAPIETVGDFLNAKVENIPSKVFPTYCDGNRVKIADISACFPNFVSTRIREGILSFDKKIKGFADKSAILSGVETRTSSPIRIVRDENFEAIGNKYIYPCGEGAGYAGGIVSASVDGIKVAIAIMEKYKKD